MNEGRTNTWEEEIPITWTQNCPFHTSIHSLLWPLLYLSNLIGLNPQFHLPLYSSISINHNPTFHLNTISYIIIFYIYVSLSSINHTKTCVYFKKKKKITLLGWRLGILLLLRKMLVCMILAMSKLMWHCIDFCLCM